MTLTPFSLFLRPSPLKHRVPTAAITYVIMLLSAAPVVLPSRSEAQPASTTISNIPARYLSLDGGGGIRILGNNFQVRARTEEIAVVILDQSGAPDAVELSLSRQEFGSSERPGPPRVTCTSGASCTDSCENAKPCNDIRNGWYRLLVSSAHAPFRRVMRLNIGPRPGSGEKCGKVRQRDLELCWEPSRIASHDDVSEVRDVNFPELREAAAYTWVSTINGTDGKPAFVATCAASDCDAAIEQDGMNFTLTFDSRELDHWRQFGTRFKNIIGTIVQ